MTIRLAKLPDKTPIKLGITVMPDLHRDLLAYAEAYSAAYGSKIAISDLVPAILSAFLQGDRGFQYLQKAK